MIRLREDMTRLGVIEESHLALFYELVEQDGRAALVTERVEGPSLATLLAAGPMPMRPQSW